MPKPSTRTIQSLGSTLRTFSLLDRTLVLADLAQVRNFLAAEGRVNKRFLRVTPEPGIAAWE